MNTSTEEPDALEKYFTETSFAKLAGVKYDPLNPTCIEIAMFAWEEKQRLRAKAKEARRHAARHRRYRCAAVLNLRATGRFAR